MNCLYQILLLADDKGRKESKASGRMVFSLPNKKCPAKSVSVHHSKIELFASCWSRRMGASDASVLMDAALEEIRALEDHLTRNPGSATSLPTGPWRAAVSAVDIHLHVAAPHFALVHHWNNRSIGMYSLPSEHVQHILRHCSLPTLSMLVCVGACWHRPRLTEVQRAARWMRNVPGSGHISSWPVILHQINLIQENLTGTTDELAVISDVAGQLGSLCAESESQRAITSLVSMPLRRIAMCFIHSLEDTSVDDPRSVAAATSEINWIRGHMRGIGHMTLPTLEAGVAPALLELARVVAQSNEIVDVQLHIDTMDLY